MDRTAHTPEQVIETLDRAFNAGDLETIMSFYDEEAIVVPQPGQEARGSTSIRNLYAKMLEPGVAARQLKVHVLEADGVALFISRWSLTRQGEAEKVFISTTVLRRQEEGGWKVVIDNAQGPAILDLQRGF